MRETLAAETATLQNVYAPLPFKVHMIFCVIGMLFGAEVALLAATAFISHRFAKKQKALENAEEKSETAQKEDEE